MMAPLSRYTRRAWLAGVMAVGLVGTAQAQQVDINGIFRAECRYPNGKAYVGSAIVSEANGTARISWAIDGQDYAGTGVRQGQVVAVDWGQPDPIVYVVMANGSLHGTWASGRALERLIRQ